jgi:transposase
MSDEEWAVFSPFLTGNRAQGGRPPRDHRCRLGGTFWIARTGAPWLDLPEEFGIGSSVYRQFRRWTLSGMWEMMLAAPAETGHLQ